MRCALLLPLVATVGCSLLRSPQSARQLGAVDRIEGQDSLAIVEATGRVLADREHRRLLVVAAVSDIWGEPAKLDEAAQPTVNELSKALARGARAELCEAGALLHQAFVNLVGVQVAADSGFVDLFVSPDASTGGPYTGSSLRYLFQRIGGKWVFVRRELVAATCAPFAVAARPDAWRGVRAVAGVVGLCVDGPPGRCYN